MLSWVVKVVPQPPELPSKLDQKEEVAAPPPANEKKVTFQDEQTTSKADKAKPETSAGNGPASQSSMLTWISSALPHPAAPSIPSPSTAEEEALPASKPEEEKGMIAWISQGLEKVVPRPSAEQPAEVRPTAAPAVPPEPEVTSKDVEPDETRPSMMEWIRHGIVKVVPQPEIHTKTEAATKAPPAPRPAPEPAPRPAPEEPVKETELQPNMMGWIVSGIGRMMPHPTTPAGSDDVQSRGKGGQNP